MFDIFFKPHKNLAIRCCSPYLTNEETEALRVGTFSNVRKRRKGNEIKMAEETHGSTSPRAATNLK